MNKENKYMEIINLPRGGGKTTYAIIEALKTGCPIIVGNQIMKKELKEYAKHFIVEMLLSIQFLSFVMLIFGKMMIKSLKK